MSQIVDSLNYNPDALKNSSILEDLRGNSEMSAGRELQKINSLLKKKVKDKKNKEKILQDSIIHDKIN